MGTGQCHEPQADFHQRKDVQWTTGSLSQVSRKIGTAGQAQKKDGQDRAESKGRRAKEQRGLANPGDLVNQSRKTGEEKGDERD